MAAKRNERGFTAGRYVLDLDGLSHNDIQSVEGGSAVSEVVNEKIGPSMLMRKHIANVKYEDIKVQLGTSIGGPIRDWITSSFNLKGLQSRKNGAVIGADYNGEETSRMDFFNALLTEVGFPALDAASKDMAKLSLAFAPEYTRNKAKAGGKVTGTFKRQQNLWSPANFKIQAPGLDKGCSRVSKIEAITIKQKVTENPIGELRDYEKEPASVEIPNLVVTLAESHGDEFYNWHEDFVIKGNCGEDKEKDFTITYLDQTRQKTLLELKLLRCGIFKLSVDKLEAGAEGIRKLKAEMYCEEIQFGQYQTV